MLTEHLESQHVAATEVWAPESWTERAMGWAVESGLPFAARGVLLVKS